MKQIPLVLWLLAAPALAQTILLDDFEDPEIRVADPRQERPEVRLLWNQYESDDTGTGTETVTTEQAYSGRQSLAVTIDDSRFSVQFRPTDTTQHLMHEYVQPPEDWQLDTYNRMELWLMVPPGTTTGVGSTRGNIYVGTYVRCSTCKGYEGGGSHYYHFVDIPYTGRWHKIVLDSHPTTRRGLAGAIEPGDLPYPTGEAGWGYLDALTRFYIHATEALPSPYPQTLYLDAVRLYRDDRPENVDQIASMNVGYDPASDRYFLGWSRRKDEASNPHEVAWSYTDIHETGWDAATSGGSVVGPGNPAYPRMEWWSEPSAIDSSQTVYFGIRPAGATLFRVIDYPAAGSAPPAPPPQPPPPEPPPPEPSPVDLGPLIESLEALGDALDAVVRALREMGRQ